MSSSSNFVSRSTCRRFLSSNVRNLVIGLVGRYIYDFAHVSAAQSVKLTLLMFLLILVFRTYSDILNSWHTKIDNSNKIFNISYITYKRNNLC